MAVFSSLGEIMKLRILLFAFILSACTGHYDVGKFDLVKADEAMLDLKKKSAKYKGQIPKDQWPEYITAIGANRVFITKEGIYIELDRFFVDESGLFSPYDKAFTADTTEDPAYLHLGGQLYSYHRKG